MRWWARKKKAVAPVNQRHEPDSSAQESLAEAQRALEKLHKQRSEVTKVSSTLRSMREKNHFQELWGEAMRGK